jgi:hypothetical protein
MRSVPEHDVPARGSHLVPKIGVVQLSRLPIVEWLGPHAAPPLRAALRTCIDVAQRSFRERVARAHDDLLALEELQRRLHAFCCRGASRDVKQLPNEPAARVRAQGSSMASGATLARASVSTTSSRTSGGELLAAGAERELPRLDEKLG